MARYLLTFLSIVTFIATMAQPGVAINTNGTPPAPAALLDVSSINKGVLLPRMSSAQRKILPNPQAGLLVFDLDKSTFYLYDGFAWRPMAFTSEQQLTLIERTPTPPVQDDKQVNLGADVDIFGLYAVAGAPGEAVGNNYQQGVAYVYYKQDGTWNIHQKLQAADGGVTDAFGKSVAMYNDLVVVGAPGAKVNGVDAAGAVYIYKRVGTVWSMIKKIVPAIAESSAGFGLKVSVHNGKVLIGSPYKTINGVQYAGTAYLYEYINNDWALSKTFMSAVPVAHGYFSQSLKIFNNDVVLGFPGNKINGVTSGSVQVFTRNTINNTWAETTIKPQTLSQNLSFGSAVGIYEDRLVVGAIGYLSTDGINTYFGAGACYLFTRSLGNWGQLGQRDVNEENAGFGDAVAVNGMNIMIGSPGYKNTGRVLVGPWNTIRFHQDVDRVEVLDFGKRLAISGDNFIIGVDRKYDGMGCVQFGTVD